MNRPAQTAARPEPIAARRRMLGGCGAAALCAAIGRPANAQPAPAWPTRTVRLMVGFPGGSSPDSVARVLAESLSPLLGQPVIVDNRAGASGTLATNLVAKATDDHTLGVVINGNLTTAKDLNPRLGYDPVRDLSYLSLLTTSPLALVTRPDLPDGRAFFDAATKAGDRWNYGSVGNGSLAHLGMELLKTKVPGLRPVHVPYQGNPAVIVALLAGQIELALVPPGLALPHAKTGRLRIVGLTGGRSTLAPEAAPLADLGVRDLDLEVWTALVGPAGLSKAAQQRLNETVPALLRTPDVRQRLLAAGWNAVGSAPQGLRLRVDDEAKAMRAVIRSGKLQLD